MDTDGDTHILEAHGPHTQDSSCVSPITVQSYRAEKVIAYGYVFGHTQVIANSGPIISPRWDSHL
jgi:hypothetical protein